MKVSLLPIFFCAVLVAMGLPQVHAVDAYDFKSESDKKRYLDFVKDLRCPMCQNQNLDGSNSKISIDLRRQLHQMIDEGKSDTEIVAFMTERYGEFILYKPRLNQDTAVLWGLPIALALIGMVVITLIVRRARSRQAPELSTTELERAATLLNTSDTPYNTPCNPDTPDSHDSPDNNKGGS